MIEEALAAIDPIRPYLSTALILIVIIYIFYKSNLFKQTYKLTKEATSTKEFIKSYSSLSFGLIKSFQVLIVKYTLYIALYGFIIYNAQAILGFEYGITFAVILVLARIQLKSSGIDPKLHEELRKKYIIQRKMLDELMKKQ